MPARGIAAVGPSGAQMLRDGCDVTCMRAMHNLSCACERLSSSCRAAACRVSASHVSAIPGASRRPYDAACVVHARLHHNLLMELASCIIIDERNAAAARTPDARVQRTASCQRKDSLLLELHGIVVLVVLVLVLFSITIAAHAKAF